MKRPAVFLDRDGTLNEQMGYINHVRRFVLLANAAEAVRLFNRHGYLTLVVSNQAGVAKGYFPEELVHEVHDRMKGLLAEQGARIDGIFFCPHHPHAEVMDYRVACDCRKPRTGLLKRALEVFDVDMEHSFVIGDRCSDLEFAHRSNLPGILVRTGYGLGEIDYVLPKNPYGPVHIADDLLDAARWILARGRFD